MRIAGSSMMARGIKGASAHDKPRLGKGYVYLDVQSELDINRVDSRHEGLELRGPAVLGGPGPAWAGGFGQYRNARPRGDRQCHHHSPADHHESEGHGFRLSC